MLAICASLPVAAQSPRDSAVAIALSRFRVGHPIRVALLRSPWAGEFQRVGGDTLFFGSPGQPPMAIRFNAIDTVWRQGDHLRRGAWIGGTTLGLLGFAAVLISRLSNDTPTSNDLRTGDIGAGLAWGAGLGTVGGLAGGLIGSAFKRWVVMHPPPEETLREPSR